MTIVIPTGVKVFMLAGAFGSPTNLPKQLGGEVTNGNTPEPVYYPNNIIHGMSHIAKGAVKLDAAITGYEGQKIVFAHSLGAVVCAYWLATAGLSVPIDPDLLQFVLIGNSVRPYGGWCYYSDWYPGALIPDTETAYGVVDYAAQYDGWADWPPGAAGAGDGMFATSNIAVKNATAGQHAGEHNYADESLYGTNNVAHQVGNVTYLWSTTSYPLPMYANKPRAQWVALDQANRPAIEAEYSRPVTIAAPDYPP